MAAMPAMIEPTMMTSKPAGWGRLRIHYAILAHQISLTILAMMKAPMLIHTIPPSPVTISQSSVKKPPM